MWSVKVKATRVGLGELHNNPKPHDTSATSERRWTLERARCKAAPNAQANAGGLGRRQDRIARQHFGRHDHSYLRFGLETTFIRQQAVATATMQALALFLVAVSRSS